MGAYLEARFNQAVATARKHGMTVTLYPRHEITDIRRAGARVRLVAHGPQTDGCPERFADAVLLATGHWFTHSRQENYFDSPWPANKLLADIPPGAQLAVIGTSLSAIETVLTLTSDGHFVGDAGGRFTYIASNTPKRVTLYSRSGLLPKVRGKLGAHVNTFLTPSALKKIRRQTLAATFELLNAELEAIYGRPIDWQQLLEPAGCPAEALRHYVKEAETGDAPEGSVIWQTVLYQAFPYIREWYLKLTDHDRQRFDRDYTSAFFAHAATQPRINAAKLLALFNAGLVSVVRLGRRYRFYRDDRHGRYCFDYTDRNGQIKSDRYRYVVDARGQPTSLATDTSELARNLLASIHAQGNQQPADRVPVWRRHAATGDREPLSDAAQHGSIRIDPQTHRVVRPDFGPGSAVYAVGAMTRGQIIDTSMAHGISRSTATIADDLIHTLSGWR
jgi:uncharacterized NAD(P)/FAD-binding protein YdhS